MEGVAGLHTASPKASADATGKSGAGKTSRVVPNWSGIHLDYPCPKPLEVAEHSPQLGADFWGALADL